MATVKVGEHLKPAVEALQAGKLSDASQHCQNALQQNPDDLGAIHILSTIASRLGRLDDAVAYFNKGLKLAPTEPTMLCGLATVRTLQGDADEAMSLYDRALKSMPGSLMAVSGKASLLERIGKLDEARALLQPIIDAGKEDPAIATVYARLLADVGKPREAIDLLDRHINRVSADRPISPNHQDPRARMFYLKGRVLDELGEYDRAWDAWLHANEIGRGHYDERGAVQHIDALMQIYSAQQMAELPRAHTKTQVPVFIASMPRSGSTLVERIIAAHPAAHGIGEDMGLLTRINEIAEETDAKTPYPASAPLLTQESLDRLSSRYLSHIRALSPRAERIIDKNLKNFLLIGFIELLMPAARIIHVRRDPMDTCLSCFMAPLNPMTHAYATDLHNLAVQVQQFDRIMQHWHAVSKLPILTVEYENLVRNQEAVTREIIDFCGLPWDDRCLQFHAAPDLSMTTESYDQVRKPMYETAAGRWKHYEKYMESAKDVLQGATAATPA